MKRILIINGHPNLNSYNVQLSKAYAKGAISAGAEVQTLFLAELQFNPVLLYGYNQRMDLEKDLLDAWEKIKWAEHIVVCTPIWWGGITALLKGFFDRLFLPGMAFKYRENSPWWDKLLEGKTAHIISTMDTPVLFYRIMYGNAGIKQLKNNILEFCGIKVKHTTAIAPIRNSSLAFREKWLSKVEDLGKALK